MKKHYVIYLLTAVFFFSFQNNSPSKTTVNLDLAKKVGETFITETRRRATSTEDSRVMSKERNSTPIIRLPDLTRPLHNIITRITG